MLLFLPLMILLRVDCVMPERVAMRLRVILCSVHNSSMRLRVASPMSNAAPPLRLIEMILLLYPFFVEKLNSKELTMCDYCVKIDVTQKRKRKSAFLRRESSIVLLAIYKTF